MSGELKKDRPFRSLLLLFRGMRLNLLISLLFYIFKHSPLWVSLVSWPIRAQSRSAMW
ncbi:hypothetical protein [Paenibacillus camerounensis]|uniref:hypothetical protein n=1 Tax=Paenibacillus camerounensis TaxID=1243663 RepID=UPI000A846FDB|nr:hypothetical protein [Paenibacillus camerounensis]